MRRDHRSHGGTIRSRATRELNDQNEALSRRVLQGPSAVSYSAQDGAFLNKGSSVTTSRQAAQIYDEVKAIGDQGLPKHVMLDRLSDCIQRVLGNAQAPPQDAVEAAVTVLSVFSVRNHSAVSKHLQTLVGQLDEPKSTNLRAYSAYIQLLLHRASAAQQELLELQRLKRRKEIERAADVWRRRGTPEPDHGILNRITTLRREDPAAMVDTAYRLLRSAVEVGPTLDIVAGDVALHASYLFRRLDLARAVIDERLDLSIELTQKTLWRMMRAARICRDEVALDDTWTSYLQVWDANVQNTWGERGSTATYDLRIRQEYVGAKLDLGQTEGALDLFERLCNTLSPAIPPKEVEDLVLHMLAPGHARHRVTEHLQSFWQAGMQRPVTASHLATVDYARASLVSWLITGEEAPRLDLVHFLVRSSIHDATPDDADVLDALVKQAVDVTLASVYRPGVEAATFRAGVQDALSIVAAYALKFGLPHDLPFIHRVVDALALAGMHSEATGIIRPYVTHEEDLALSRQDGDDDSPMKALRRVKAQELVESGLGFHVDGARPTLEELLEAASIPISLLPKGRIAVISNRLRTAIETAIKGYSARNGGSPDSLMTLMQGDLGRVAQVVATSRDDPTATRLPYLRLASRAPGCKVPPTDPVYSGDIRTITEAHISMEDAQSKVNSKTDLMTRFFATHRERMSSRRMASPAEGNPRASAVLY